MKALRQFGGYRLNSRTYVAVVHSPIRSNLVIDLINEPARQGKSQPSLPHPSVRIKVVIPTRFPFTSPSLLNSPGVRFVCEELRCVVDGRRVGQVMRLIRLIRDSFGVAT